MGRYVEEIIDLSDRIGYASHIYQMNDGNLLISDNVNAFLVSADDGITWEAETEERSWKTPLVIFFSHKEIQIKKTAAVIRSVFIVFLYKISQDFIFDIFLFFHIINQQFLIIPAVYDHQVVLELQQHR